MEFLIYNVGIRPYNLWCPEKLKQKINTVQYKQEEEEEEDPGCINKVFISILIPNSRF